MYQRLKELWRDRRGNVLAIVAGCMPLLVGAAGLATDTIEWTLWKRELQRAADSAAIAGVYDRVEKGDTDDTSGVVSHDLELNQHTGLGLEAGYPHVSFPADDGDKEDQVAVELAVRRALPFSSMFMDSAPLIIARATAASVPGSDEYCVVALEKKANKTGITIGGNSSIEMDCGIISNSPSSNSSAINNGNASAVTASVVASVGGMQYSTNWNVGKYDPYTSAVDDPYGDIDPTPAEMTSCGSNPPAATETTNVTSDATLCYSSINVASGTTLDLGSNKTVFVTGKNASTAGNVVLHGELKCDQCTIILTNKDSSSTAKIGTFDMQAQSTLDVSAPQSGKYKGIAVFQDRRATDQNGASSPNKFNGGGDQVVSGALYFPSQELSYSGNGTATAVCTRFVARRVVFTGNSTTSNKFKKGSDCPFYDDDPIGGGRRVRLVA